MKQLKDKKDKLCAMPHLCILIHSLPCPLQKLRHPSIHALRVIEIVLAGGDTEAQI